MLLSPRKNGLDSLFNEARVFEELGIQKLTRSVSKGVLKRDP